MSEMIFEQLDRAVLRALGAQPVILAAVPTREWAAAWGRSDQVEK